MNQNPRGPAYTQIVQSSHKDAVINSLKKELLQLKDLQHDFVRLNDQVANIESRYALLLDEKERSQKEHRIKLDMNKNTISQLRNEIDNLKIQCHKTSVQTDDTQRENATLKRLCDNRQNEITALMSSNAEMEKNNLIQLEENRNISNNLKQLKEERNKNQNQCERLSKNLEESINILKQLEKEARKLESENNGHQNMLIQAEKDYSDLIQQRSTREDHVASNKKRLQLLNDEIKELTEKTHKLEKQNAKAQLQYKNVCENLDNSILKNRELTNRLKNHEGILRNTQHQLDQAVLKRQELSKAHTELAGQNKILDLQIDKTLMNIIDYQRINNQLKKEVENYIESDQQARTMLNRRDAMRGLLDQVSNKLQKTQEQIAHLR